MSAPLVTTEQLIAYAAGELAPQERARIDALLQGDPDSVRALARITALVQLARSDDSVAPPAAAVVAAQELFRERRARTQPRESWLARLQRLVAERVFDSRLQPALQGIRGAREQRQLSFESAVADVDLEITPRVGDESTRIRGQISIHAERPVRGIVLTHPGEAEPVQEVVPDAHGEFSFAPDPGQYSIVVLFEDLALELTDIDVE